MTKIILPARRGEETPVKFSIRCPAFLPRPSAKVNRQIAKYFEAAAARLPKEARNRRKEWKRREIWRKQQLSSAGLILTLLCGSYAEGRTDVKIHRYRPEAESVSRK